MTLFIPSSCIQLLPHSELDLCLTKNQKSSEWNTLLFQADLWNYLHLFPHSQLVPFTCDLEPIPSWFLIITPVFITVHPCNRLPFFCLIYISIETCLCYLPFNAPLTWLHVYMYTVATDFGEKSPCGSTPPPSLLNSLLLDFLLLDSSA